MKFNTVSKLFIGIFLIVPAAIIINGFTMPQKNLSHKKGGDDDKPAEEVYKNIQVLKGMPSNDLHMVMHFMRASLNVKCSFCHVHDEKTNTWNWESDSLEEKKTAREMITMTKNINNQNFEGNMGVTCFTCHRGSTNPMKTPSLPQQPPKDFTHEDRDKLPTVDVILDNYNKVLGVTDPSSVKTKYSKGTSMLWDGKSYPVEIYQQAPDKFLSILTAPDGSKIYRGYDGTTGWTKNGDNIQPVEGYTLDMLKQYADFYGQINPKGKYSDLKVIGTDTANGGNCYILRAIISDKKFDRLYFDISTGLLIRVTTYSKSILGNIPERIEYTNYSSAGGIMAPMNVEFSYLDPWAEVSRQFTDVKYNVSLDNISFTKPAK